MCEISSPLTMKQAIEENKRKHIEYILAVEKYCELNRNEDDTRKRLNELSLEELYKVSSQAENLYEARRKNELLDKLLKEVDELGVEAVKKKYLPIT